MLGERRKYPFEQERQKFSTQRAVTYWLLAIFASVAGVVLWQDDQSERSMVLQTVINLTLLAVGYWLGASKQSQDSHVGTNVNSSAPTSVTVEAEKK